MALQSEFFAGESCEVEYWKACTLVEKLLYIHNQSYVFYLLFLVLASHASMLHTDERT